MSVTTANAIKQYLEGPVGMGGAALGIQAYRDEAPPKTPRPYVTITEATPTIPDPLEDGTVNTVREHVMVDLWMDWKNLDTNAIVESFTLPTAIAKALAGCHLLPSGSGAPPTTVYGILIQSVGPRILEKNQNSVHFPFWITVLRAL